MRNLVKDASARERVLHRLFLREERKGEKLVTLIILCIVLPVLIAVAALVVFVEKFHLNSVFNFLFGIVLTAYYLFVYFLLKRNLYRPFMKYISVTLNVVCCTLLLYGYSLGSGWLHSIRTVVMSCYALVIVISGLYQNPVIPVYTGILTVVFYSLLTGIALIGYRVPVGRVETFLTPAYSYDIYIYFIGLLILVAFIVANVNRRYRKMLDRLLHSRAYNWVIKKAEKQKTSFFVNLAHETKTPLTIIANYLEEYVKTHGDNQELHIIRHNINKLKADMINFLDYEKLQRGQLFYNHKQIVDAARLIMMQTHLFKELARKKQIELEAVCEDSIYAQIDPAALERIVNNLLDNAIKYTPHHGLVKVTLGTNGERLVLKVSDTGPGIPKAEQQSIFKPFYQLSHEKRNLQGIGMGLNIVKKIVSEANGELHLESAPEKGATFTVSLQRITPQQADDIIDDFQPNQSLYEYEEPQLLAEECIKGRSNLLIIDDNKALLAYLQKKLQATYNVFYATSGREAFSKIQSIPRPQVIISDIMMDDMDGFEFYKQLSVSGDYGSIPLIFLTALTSLSDKLKGLKMGAVDYIYKPFHIEEIQEKVQSLIAIQAALTKENILKLGGQLYKHLAKGEVRTTEPEQTSGRIKQLHQKYSISRQQLDIIALLKIGLLRKEISERLGISMNTVKTQMARLFKKCRVNNKTELLNIFHG